MKIAIVGTGAMGSIYAARLAEAGNEVWAVDAWQAHVDAINANGLCVDGPGWAGQPWAYAPMDVYSAGVCAWVCLSRCVPFGGVDDV